MMARDRQGRAMQGPGANAPARRRSSWFLAGSVFLVALGAALWFLHHGGGAPVPSGEFLQGSAPPATAASYVGSARCAVCHTDAFAAWKNSDHDLAMDMATDSTVRGDFDDRTFAHAGVATTFSNRDGRYFVRTDGPDGTLQDFEIRYTFGWEPLQQYLIELDGGRIQPLGIAWDTRPASQGGQRWFHLYPDETLRPGDPLHWTGRDQTWNYQCAECHSTNLRKNYDLDTNRYRTTWDEIDVACEACHGPGSRHVAWAEAGGADDGPRGLGVDLADRDGGTWSIDAATGKPQRTTPRREHTQIETCARCHSRRGILSEDYVHGKPLADTHRLSLLEAGLYFPDGQIQDEVYVYGSFIQSKMYAAGVTCTDCHDPHTLRLKSEGNLLCAPCHVATAYDTQAHHHHAPGSAGARCTACHMPERTYMVVDERADHSLRVPRPDLSLQLGTPNACNGCHKERTAAWAAAAIRDWTGNANHEAAHFGQTLSAAREDAPDAPQRLVTLALDRTQPGIARATALAALRGVARPAQVVAVQDLAQDADPLVRTALAALLERAAPEVQQSVGFPLLDDPVRSVRLQAARTLAGWMQQDLPMAEKQRLAAALAAERAAQQSNADRPEAHLNLGVLELAQGNLQAAERDYTTALRLAPDFLPAYVNMADLYRQQGRDEEGEALLRRGLGLDAANADLHHALGLLLARQKKPVEAVAELARAAALAPESARYAYVHAVALHSTGEVARAMATLAAALERHRADREILFALATMHLESGDPERARQYAADLERFYPDDAEVDALLRQLNRR